MAKDADVNTNWERSAGIYNCTGGCGRTRLPASEFSKKQVERALDSLNTLADRDIREGPGHESQLWLSAVCRGCIVEKEEREKAEAHTRREEREKALEERQALEETVLEPPERIATSLPERPLGMTPSKADESLGYVVAKVSDGKPAFKAGIRPGWRVATVAGKTCEGLNLEAVQALLKAAELPVAVEFDSLPSGADWCTSCLRVLVIPLFSRKMRTKPPDKRRCTSCVEASEEGSSATASEAQPTCECGSVFAAIDPKNPTVDAAICQKCGKARPKKSQLAELQELCAETASQAEKVTGLKPVRGGSFVGRGGRGRGRGGYS